MSTSMAVDHTTAADVTPAKRKHTGDDQSAEAFETAGSQQSDILEVLRQHEIAQPFLDHEFKQTSEHTTKRAKLSNNTSTTSIGAKLSKSAYASLEDLRKDAIVVSDAIIEQARNENQPDSEKPAIAALKRVQRAKMMRQTIEELVQRESRNEAEAVVKLEEDSQLKAETSEEVGTVLTLFGNAPGPKQLFSSFQHATTTSDGRAIKPALALEELSLPNGLTTTKIKPLNSITAEKPTTFADSFPPAFALPTLSAPKPARRPSTRDKTVLWEFKDSTRGVKRGGLTTQPQSTADWLSYGGMSSRAKRKLRERALSDGHSSVEGEDLAVELEKQEEALFRQAYSSYAPAYDNSRSVVDVTLKNLVWWHKVGNKKYDARFRLDPALREGNSQPQDIQDDIFDDSGFAQAVEDYVEDEELEVEDKDLTKPEDVLDKITTLLQTLASMQIIRSSKTQASSLLKAPVSPEGVPDLVPVRPDVPTQEEFDTYEELQREIAYLVLQLPPYAVAKLNGNQLADLGVSKIITFEARVYRGQMEEDAAARLARHTAAATAAGVASLNRATSGSNPHYSSTSRTPAIGQSANTRYGANTGYGNRTPATAPAQQRPSSQQNYGTPTGASRQYTPGTAQYARQGAPASYSQTNVQYRPASNYGYNTMPTAQRAVQPATQPFQRSQMAAANAVSYQTQYAPTKPLAPEAGRSTPVSYASPGQTPVNGIRAPPPLLARATSGTPQPDTNGHA